MQTNSVLCHYGIPGMHWGRRKSTNKTTTTVMRETSEDHKLSREIRRKRISELSNKELELLTRRMQLEKQYKNLTPTQVSKGKAVVNRVLKTVKTANDIYNAYNSPIAKSLRNAAVKKI